MMNKTLIQVMALVTLFWVVTLLTVIRELSKRDRKPKYRTAEEENMVYEETLLDFRKKYNIRHNPTSAFDNMKPINLSLNFEETLEIVKGVDYPLGYDGRPVVLEDDVKSHIAMKIRRGWRRHGFNVLVSDIIPINRSLVDVRHEWCINRTYSTNLPQVSVVITFHNEPWSTLMRTVYSVLTRTPQSLLKQIILFDDFSNPGILSTLENDVRSLPKVVLVRASSRRGLIQARIQSVNYVTAPVVVFLDSHCECTEGWLEPLLDRIAEDPSRVVSPVIDRIHENTFEYIPQDAYDLQIGGFNWDLHFIWRGLPRYVIRKRKNLAEPFETPTISGGIIAIDVAFFWKLGLYDPGFGIWGAENLELSFKAWMCGGSLEIVPCSHVGHVFRMKFPYPGVEEAAIRNNFRLAEVWLDDYKKYYYERIGFRKVDFGDVSSRLELRKLLGCKSFKWYLDKVYKGIELPDKYVASGQIRSVIYDNMCLQSNVNFIKETVTLEKCHHFGGDQYWIYTKNGELKRNDLCLDFEFNTVLLYICRGRVLSQVWLYENKTNYIRNMSNQKCLKILRKQDGKNKLVLENCLNSLAQKWTMDNYDIERRSPDLKTYAQREILPDSRTEKLVTLQILK